MSLQNNGSAPTKIFMQALSILLNNGFSPEDLGVRHLASAAEFLESCLALESGVTGFAPYVDSDADNTARAISTLARLGKPHSAQGLIIRYETREFFKTYTQDRSPSFRTNCLVLKAFLDLVPSNRDEQITQITKTVKFITNTWWTTNGLIEDDTNASPNYPIMLMADALMRLVDLHDQKSVSVLDDIILKDKVFVCLFQALTRTMQTQNQDGSWGRGQRCETTAYGILSMARMATLSSAPRIKMQIGQALENGRKYLAKNFKPAAEPDLIWNGKVATGSKVLYQAYVLAAQNAPTQLPKPGYNVESRFEVPLAKVAIQTKYYSRQPWFANIAEWQIQAFLVESYLFLPQLRDVRYAVFPKDNLMEDKYFDSIPFAWIASSTINERFIGPEFLFQMMVLTFLNRQFEEYAQNVIEVIFAGCAFEIEDVIHGIFEELENHKPKDQCFCDSTIGCKPHDSNAEAAVPTPMTEARAVLYRFISHIINHPYVLMASHQDQDQLRSELLIFLLGRISGSAARNVPAPTEDEAIAKTASPTASDHTSHQFSFAFLSCIVGNQKPGGIGLRLEFLETPEQQYLVADLCKRLSILSFMSTAAANGSSSEAPYQERTQTRSRATTVSSGHRTSFHSTMSSDSIGTASSSYSDGSDAHSPVSSVSSAPSRSPIRESFTKPPTSAPASAASGQMAQHTVQLNRLLAHERRCMNMCLESLTDAGISRRTYDVLKLFVDVSELAEQIFHDPNVGSYQANVAHQIIEKAKVIEKPCILEPPPVPPKRTQTQGSVSAARAALEIPPLRAIKRESHLPPVPSVPTISSRPQPSEPAQPPRVPTPNDLTPRAFSFITAEGPQLTPTQDDIKFKSAAQQLREFSFSKPSANERQSRRFSQSSVEMSRIERIMADIDGGNPRNSTLPLHPALRHKTSEQSLPQPRINPMLPVHPVPRRENTSIERISPFQTAPPMPEDVARARAEFVRKSTMRLDAQARVASSGAMPEDVETVRLAKARMSQIQRAESKAKAKARDAAAERERKRASCLQARAMAEAWITEPMPRSGTIKAADGKPKRGEKLGRAMTAQSSVGTKSDSDGLSLRSMTDSSAGSGWTKAPTATNNNGEFCIEAERERAAKLQRASRLAGSSRFKAPF